MKSTLYVLTFNEINADARVKITAYLDTRKDIVQDWYYCMMSSIFVVSSLPATGLREFLCELPLLKESRFFIAEVKKYPANEGWLPQAAWDFINKYASY